MKTCKLLLVVLSFAIANIAVADEGLDKQKDSVYSWGHWNKLTPPAAGPVGFTFNPGHISVGVGDTSVTTPPLFETVVIDVCRATCQAQGGSDRVITRRVR